MLHQMKFGKVFILLGVLALGGLIVGAQPALAVDSGGTIEDNLCMQRIFMGPPPTTVSNSNLLNCTAMTSGFLGWQ